ncbi:unnamed protein product [Cunninghamella blakesleeana]
MLNHSNPIDIEMALDTLSKICEDATHDLDQEINGEQPLDYIIPKLITFINHPNQYHRKRAMMATNQFVMLKSKSLFSNIDIYVHSLFQRAEDSEPEIRQELCRSIIMILDAEPQILVSQMPTIIQYMIHCIQDQDENVALEACGFWTTCVKKKVLKNHLIAALPQIIPILIRHMVYTDMDILLLGGGDDNNNYHHHQYHQNNDMDNVNNDNNINENADLVNNDLNGNLHVITPRYVRKKQLRNTGMLNRDQQQQHMQNDIEISDDDDDDDDDDDSEDDMDEDFDVENVDDDEFYSEWTLRKCCAVALETLTLHFNKYVIMTIIPLLKDYLDHDYWRMRESGILALGAIAKNGMHHMTTQLPLIIDYLLKSLDDPKPLVCSTACWTMGRYVGWIIEQYNTPEGRQNIYEPVLFKLLEKILSKNKRVQESSCSAIATLEEHASSELVPYIRPILIHFGNAFTLYKSKNMHILYDALGTLAESVGKELNQPQHLEILMPLLINRWNTLSDHDVNIIPLFMCLASVTAALGTGFERYAEPVFTRCVKLVASTLHASYLADQHPDLDPPDVEFMMFALDLLSGLVQGLGPLIGPFLSRSAPDPKLLDLLDVCVRDTLPEILNSTFVLIGDIAIANFDNLEPYLHSYLPDMIDQIVPDIYNMTVCNNSMWAIGEIALRWGPKIEPYIPQLVSRLYPILADGSSPKTSSENATVTLGRLGYACPSVMVKELPSFIHLWLNKSSLVNELNEKDSAFRGLCLMIKQQPEAGFNSLGIILQIISTWENPSSVLKQEFEDILHGYKKLLLPDTWTYLYSSIDPEAQHYLTTNYHI